MKRHHLMGEVSLLGLDEFGQNPGMNPLWGAAIGGGVAGITSITIQQTQAGQPIAQDASFWGFMAGLGATGVLYAMKSTRHAAFGSALAAFFASGLPWLSQKLFGTLQVPAAAMATTTAPTTVPAGTTVVAPTAVPAGTSGVGMAKIQALNGGHGLGIPKVKYLNGLGLPTIAPQPPAVGAIPGVAGPAFAGAQLGAARPPVSLLGSPTPASRQVSLLGGPPVHGLSAAYGATLLGGGR